MAGDWIKVESVTPDKPEVWQMAEMLEIDPDAVVGKLIRIWIWADQQTYSGDAASVTLALLDRVTSVTNFGKALQKVGWLREENDGFTFPHFDRHNGQTAKQRALTARRMRRSRGKKPLRKCDAASVTPSSLLLSLSSLNKEVTVSDNFEASWAEWLEYRKEIRKPMSKSTAVKLGKKLLDWGEDRAVAAIDHTIASGWQGLREPEQDRNGKAPKQHKLTLLDED